MIILQNRSTFPSQTGENGSRKDDFGRYRIYRRRNESPDKES